MKINKKKRKKLREEKEDKTEKKKIRITLCYLLLQSLLKALNYLHLIP